MDAAGVTVSDWRTELPTLAAKLVTLREPIAQDVEALVDLLSSSDASTFGLDAPITDGSVRELVDRVRRDRAAGASFTYAVTLTDNRAIVGLIQVRQLDPAFETADWECTLAPGARGTGVFLEAARLAGSFTFGVVGTHRLESRALLHNGRANGALRKLGAVQEGILRRSLQLNGEYVDQVLWSLLKEDWTPHWVAIGPRVH